MKEKKEEIKSGDLVVPGEVLGVIEEYIPDNGTYQDNGQIVSTRVGVVKKDERTKRISVMTKNKRVEPRKGAIVLGQVQDAKRQLVDVAIAKIGSGDVYPPISGTLHISCISGRYTKNISDAYRVGDFVKAEVRDEQKQPCYLSTVGNEFGCILAHCTRCGAVLKRTGRNQLECPECDNVESRKIADEYIKS